MIENMILLKFLINLSRMQLLIAKMSSSHCLYTQLFQSESLDNINYSTTCLKSRGDSHP